MRFACQMGMCDYRFHQEETGEAPPTFPLEVVPPGNVRKMLGKCSELEAPPPLPLPWVVFPAKCSENVRNW